MLLRTLREAVAESDFIKYLKTYREYLTKHQIQTLKSQAIVGNIYGARGHSSLLYLKKYDFDTIKLFSNSRIC